MSNTNTPDSGRMPEAIELTAYWTIGKALLGWPKSTDEDLHEYQVRMTIGPEYSTTQESVVGIIGGDGEGTQDGGGNLMLWGTTDGLVNRLDKATFRVYVVLSNGNEKGSNEVTVTRGA